MARVRRKVGRKPQVIGYCVEPAPQLASFRFRVAIPASRLTVPYRIGVTGSPTFFYKDGNPTLAKALKTGVVYDVVNDHFSGPRAASYHAMAQAADVLTTCSEVMRETVRRATGRESVVIDDPYENECAAPAVDGDRVLWFGHGANLSSLKPYADTPGLVVCSNVAGAIPWSHENEADCIESAAVVLLTGNNPGASTNRIVKAIRAGRFVVTPGGVPSWEQFREFCWIGDVSEGVRWALNNREEACKKILAGQAYTLARFTPSAITGKWMEVFGSTSGAATKSKRAGPA